MVTPQQIKEWIEKGLPDSRVEIDGDGHHFEALIVCGAFDGKNRVQRHQMVYKVLGDRMKSEIHALSMQTRTPAEAGQ
jgi:acid stress-induced BolA-like protein IbaG/YrbA